MRAWLAVVFIPALLHAETNLEKGKRLVNQSIEALGGQKFLSMTDRTESGRAYSFYRERLTGLSVAKIYTKYYDNASGPLKVKERQAFGKNEDSIVLFDGSNGYSLTYRGAKPVEKARYERYVRTTRLNVLYIFRERMKEPGLILEYKGSDVFENLPVDNVDITDSEDNVVSVKFAQDTHLPVYQSHSHIDPEYKERVEEVTRFTKYRDVNGIKWPFNMLRERNGEKIFEIFSESVSINTSVPDKQFQIPAGVKMLPAEEQRSLVPLPSKTKEELHKEK